MSDPMVIIEEKAENAFQSVRQFMVRKSNFHRLYEDLGFVIARVVGDSEGDKEIAPEQPEATTAHIDAASAPPESEAATAGDAPEHPIAEAPAEEAAETATEAPATEAAAAPAEQAARIDLVVAPEATPSDAVPTEPAAPVESSTEPPAQPAA